jgi:mRNA interferase MazF
MKTAISLPDETFERVERAAAKLGVSRSEFFARAAERWLDALDDDQTTAAIKRAIAGLPNDSAFTDAAAEALVRDHDQRDLARRTLVGRSWPATTICSRAPAPRADRYNRSTLRTVTVVVLTTTTQLAGPPGNVVVPSDVSGLSVDSVVNVTQIATVDRGALDERGGALPDWLIAQVDAGLMRALGLTHQ